MADNQRPVVDGFTILHSVVPGSQVRPCVLLSRPHLVTGFAPTSWIVACDRRPIDMLAEVLHIHFAGIRTPHGGAQSMDMLVQKIHNLVMRSSWPAHVMVRGRRGVSEELTY